MRKSKEVKFCLVFQYREQVVQILDAVLATIVQPKVFVLWNLQYIKYVELQSIQNKLVYLSKHDTFLACDADASGYRFIIE